jgi:hypothetical protein
MSADLVYDGVLDCFSRRWRLVIAGDYEAGAYTRPLLGLT